MPLLATKSFEAELLVGEKITLEVRALPIRGLYAFLDAVGSESSPELVALCISQPVAFIDQLSDDSYLRLLALCNELNFQRAIGLTQHDPVAALKLAKLANGVRILQGAGFGVAGMPGSVSSPGLASLASAGATGSGV